MRKKNALACMSACLLSAGAADASLILDQTGATLVSGGLNTIPNVVQSFKPSADNVAAVDVFVSGSGGPENDLTINLYSDFSGSTLSGLLASGTKADALRGQYHQIDWSPVTVTPEETYYLEFILTPDPGQFALVIGVDVSNPYDRGQVLAGGGNLFGGAVDAAFRTYAVPEPSSLALLAAGGIITMRRRRRCLGRIRGGSTC